MYAKIFSQIYDGTLCTNGPWEALVTFQQLLILADQHGDVDMTPAAISRKTTIPIEIIETGIAALLLPDPESRTPTEGGRRILPLTEGRSWGWNVVNYKHYRQIKREEDRREYHREYWKKRKLNQDSTPLNTLNTLNTTQPAQPIAEAYTYTKAVDQVLQGISAPPPPREKVPFEEIIAMYHEVLPGLPQVQKLTDARKGYIRQRWAQDLQTLEKWRNFFVFVSKSKFLTGKAGGQNGRPPFRADIEWLCKPANFVKIAEDKYHGK